MKPKALLQFGQSLFLDLEPCSPRNLQVLQVLSLHPAQFHVAHAKEHQTPPKPAGYPTHFAPILPATSIKLSPILAVAIFKSKPPSANQLPKRALFHPNPITPVCWNIIAAYSLNFNLLADVDYLQS